MSPAREAALLVVMAVVTASCAGSAAPTTTAPTTFLPEFTVTSDDGAVTLEVPAGALAEDPGITIRRLDGPPPGLGSIDSPAAYALEPDGVTFFEPVTVTVRIPIQSLGDLPPGVVPVVTLVTASAADGWELLEAQRVLRDEEVLIVAAMMNHTSTLVAIFEEVHLVVGAVDASIIAEIEVGAAARLAPRFFGVDGEQLDAPPGTSPAPVLGPGATAVPSGTALDVTCVDPGDVAVTISWNVVLGAFGDRPPSEAALRSSPFFLEVEELPMRLGVVGAVRCLDA
jgi:hypothetical protein